MKKVRKRVLYSCGLLLSCIAIGTILMIAVYSIPTENMWKNVKDSVEILENEGVYYKVLGTLNSRLDNFTDAIMICSVIASNGGGIVNDAVSNYKPIRNNDISYIQLLRAYVEHEPVGLESYGRYWHGYLVFLKPLFTVFNYSQIRQINMLVQIIVVMSICVALVKRKLTRLCIPLLVSWYLLCPITLMMSLQFSSIFYISFGACLMILLFHERLDRYYAYFFMVIGALTSYFDLLTYPTLAVLMPVTMVMVLRSQNKVPAMKPFAAMLCYGIAWGIGYLGMWAGKWCVATILTGTDYISQSLSQILLRTSTTASNGEAIALTAGLKRCIDVLLTPPAPIVLLIAAGLCLILLVKNRQHIVYWVGNVYPYILLAGVPILWIVVTCNHSSIHFWFTFRNLAASVFALMAGLLAQIGQAHECGSEIQGIASR